jgi:hypothetical protein
MERRAARSKNYYLFMSHPRANLVEGLLGDLQRPPCRQQLTCISVSQMRLFILATLIQEEGNKARRRKRPASYLLSARRFLG